MPSEASAVTLPGRSAALPAAAGSPWIGATVRTAVTAWSVYSLLFAAAVYWEVRSHGHSPARIFLFVFLVWYAWAAFTPFVAWLGNRFPPVPLSWTAAAIHGGTALILGVVHSAWWTALDVWIRPFDAMGVPAFWPGFLKTLDGRLFFEALVYMTVLGTSHAVESHQRLREREMRAVQLEASLTQARLHALELQIQPHFLFNTLHAIGGLVRQDRPSDAVAMITGLSDLLRYSLDHEGAHHVTLGREADIVVRYLDIQAIRLPDRLKVSVDVPDDVRGAAVPAMILQPLAENAVRHGIEPLSRPGEVRLTVRREADSLVIELFNSGPPFHEHRCGVGLRNTRARLGQLYGERHQFSVVTAPGGVSARLVIPFEVAPA